MDEWYNLGPVETVGIRRPGDYNRSVPSGGVVGNGGGDIKLLDFQPCTRQNWPGRASLNSQPWS